MWGLDDIYLVSSIKVFIQKFRDNRWDDLLSLWNNLWDTKYKCLKYECSLCWNIEKNYEEDCFIIYN